VSKSRLPCFRRHTTFREHKRQERFIHFLAVPFLEYVGGCSECKARSNYHVSLDPP
jgi:hypothetical protein